MNAETLMNCNGRRFHLYKEDRETFGGVVKPHSWCGRPGSLSLDGVTREGVCESCQGIRGYHLAQLAGGHHQILTRLAAAKASRLRADFIGADIEALRLLDRAGLLQHIETRPMLVKQPDKTHEVEDMAVYGLTRQGQAALATWRERTLGDGNA